MPIYEYECASCGNEFEYLIRNGQETPKCPSCASEETTKRLSVPAAARSGAGDGASLPMADGPGPGGCDLPGCGPGGCGMGFGG